LPRVLLALLERAKASLTPMQGNLLDRSFCFSVIPARHPLRIEGA